MHVSAQTRKRRKLVKTYKNVIPQKQTVTAEAWDLLLKDDKSMEWKTDTDVNNSDYFTLQSKEGAEREREERERERDVDT